MISARQVLDINDDADEFLVLCLTGTLLGAFFVVLISRHPNQFGYAFPFFILTTLTLSIAGGGISTNISVKRWLGQTFFGFEAAIAFMAARMWPKAAIPERRYFCVLALGGIAALAFAFVAKCRYLDPVERQYVVGARTPRVDLLAPLQDRMPIIVTRYRPKAIWLSARVFWGIVALYALVGMVAVDHGLLPWKLPFYPWLSGYCSMWLAACLGYAMAHAADEGQYASAAAMIAIPACILYVFKDEFATMSAYLRLCLAIVTAGHLLLACAAYLLSRMRSQLASGRGSTTIGTPSGQRSISEALYRRRRRLMRRGAMVLVILSAVASLVAWFCLTLRNAIPLILFTYFPLVLWLGIALGDLWHFMRNLWTPRGIPGASRNREDVIAELAHGSAALATEHQAHSMLR